MVNSIIALVYTGGLERRQLFTLRLREITSKWYFWLIIITCIAVFLRAIPGWINAAWGCDFGIYYGLTSSFVKTGSLFNPYVGWGNSYQYFPVLYAITGVAHWITGVDVVVLMPKIAPIFGGLSVLIFYFVVYNLIGDRRIALLSSLFLAVLPFHVYQTSHASPLTMGHFFFMLCLYLFIKFRTDSRYVAPLFISTVLLIMSHHFTTYLYLISLIFIVFIENVSVREWTAHVKLDVLYILATSGLIFSYWAFIATPVYSSFMKSFRIMGFKFPQAATISLFYVGFFVLFALIWLKRRYNLFYPRRMPTTRSCFFKFGLMMVVCLVAMMVFSVVKLPWTNFSFTPQSILFSVPLLLVFSLGVAGYRFTYFVRNGFFIRGWISALLLSFCFGLLTNSWTILPHRHLEYLMVPLSIIAVYGLRGIVLTFNGSVAKWFENVLNVRLAGFKFLSKSGFLQKRRQLLFLAVVVFLVGANAVSVYPSHVSLNVSYEVISEENLWVTDWMEENLDKNASVIASDHRLARIAEAVGFNTTIDQAIVIWTAENYSDYVDELYAVKKNYTAISHVLIDDVMRERVVHVGFGKIVYMTNESYDKFSGMPFELVYRNATSDEYLDEAHWAEIYKVNWTYIDKYLK